MTLKVIVNNYTKEEKELKLWAKAWIEKQKARQLKYTVQKKTTK